MNRTDSRSRLASIASSSALASPRSTSSSLLRVDPTQSKWHGAATFIYFDVAFHTESSGATITGRAVFELAPVVGDQWHNRACEIIRLMCTAPPAALFGSGASAASVFVPSPSSSSSSSSSSSLEFRALNGVGGRGVVALCVAMSASAPALSELDATLAPPTTTMKAAAPYTLVVGAGFVCACVVPITTIVSNASALATLPVVEMASLRAIAMCVSGGEVLDALIAGDA